jgi:AraC-like DNA-binding protein
MRKDRESIHFANPSDMSYIQIVSGTNVTNEFARHVHHKFCIGTVCRGVRLISQAGTSVMVPENAIFVINPGTAHSCKTLCKAGHDYLTFCVDREKMKDIASQISEKAQDVPYIRNILLSDTELVSKMHEFNLLLRHKDSMLRRESILFSMLSKLIIRHSDSPPTPRQVGSQHDAMNRVCKFIKTHFAKNLSLDELSKVAYLSPFHFQRLFLKNTGVSPHDYLMQWRINKAIELFREGHCIASVAVDTGFVDQSHLTRTFKRIIGITPGRYVLLHGKKFYS